MTGPDAVQNTVVSREEPRLPSQQINYRLLNYQVVQLRLEQDKNKKASRCENH